MISLTTCKQDEFTCNDGLCVDIEERLTQDFTYEGVAK